MSIESEVLNQKDPLHEAFGKKIDIDGIFTYVVDIPPSNAADVKWPPVLCVHGIAGSTLDFKTMAPELRKHARVVLIDLPGNGQSAMPSTFTAHSIVSFLQTAIEQLFGLNKPYSLIGHSYGTAHALKIASMENTNCKSVVAICPPFRMHIPGWMKMGAGIVPPALYSYVTNFFDGTGLYRRSINQFFGPHADEKARRDQLQIQLQASTYTFLQTAANLEFYDPNISGLPKCPVLVIGATDDKVCKVELSRLLHKECPSEYVEISDAGHGVMFEKPELVNESVVKFFNKELKP